MSKATIQFRLEMLREVLKQDYEDILLEIRQTQEALVTAPTRRHDYLMEYLMDRVTSLLNNCKASMEDIEQKIVQTLDEQ